MSSLIRWGRLDSDPSRALDIVHSRLDQLLSDIDGMLSKNFNASSELNPRVDITEDKDTLYYMMELPGIDPANIKVTTTNSVLSIHAEKRREETKKDHKYRSYERSFGEFTRTFSLPEGVNTDKIQAELNNGVLEIRIPLPAQVKTGTKEIKITSGNPLIETAKANGHQAVVS